MMWSTHVTLGHIHIVLTENVPSSSTIGFSLLLFSVFFFYSLTFILITPSQSPFSSWKWDSSQDLGQTTRGLTNRPLDTFSIVFLFPKVDYVQSIMTFSSLLPSGIEWLDFRLANQLWDGPLILYFNSSVTTFNPKLGPSPYLLQLKY